MSGGGVKASPRCSVEYPRDLEAQEGIETRVDVKTPFGSTDRRSDQSSGGQASGPGAGGATRLQRGESQKVKRARAGDEAGRLSVGENPCRVNLGRGSGMKQAHTVQGGANRREREKR
jgi:hypothetical protein